MPERFCPDCRTPGRLLVTASEYAHVEYYRCDDCGQVWTYRKSEPGAPPRPVIKTASETSQPE